MVEWEAKDLVKKRCSSIALEPATPFFSHTLTFFEQVFTRDVQQEDFELDGKLTLP
jgi:hypothetical protein